MVNKKIEQASFPSSSNLDRAAYDPMINNLTILFRSGNAYTYVGVPRKKFKGLMEADSAGKYFTSQIRNNYDFMKVLSESDLD
jgi:hypothetical protein